MAVLAGLALAAPAAAQVVQPPPPATFDAQIRYRIRAARAERTRQFDEMTRALASAGFQRTTAADDDDVGDPNAERLTGRLPSSAVTAVLREPHVRSLLLVPAGWTWPDAPDARVAVRIDLVTGLTPARQQLLHRQVAAQVTRLGFAENVGYDTRNSTHLFGRLPVAALESLLADVRYQPGGWLAPDAPAAALPEPLRSTDAIRVIEVVSDPAGLPPAANREAPAVEAALAKLSPDLRAALADEATAAKPMRFEVVLFNAVPPGDIAWRAFIQSLGAVTIEGHAGQVVTVVAGGAVARQLASLPGVATVRLPIPAALPVASVAPINPADALAHTNLTRLHLQNGQGQGVRLAIVDSDFAGIQRYLGRTLPATTRLLDLTAERNPNLLPDPIPADRPGRGTLAALAAARAAPRAELILVRVAVDAPHQVLSVARAVAAETFRSEAMTVRNAELLFDHERLKQTRALLNSERQALSEDYRSDEATQKRRIDMQLRLGELTHEEQEYDRRIVRFLNLEQGMMNLRHVAVVANNQAWLRGWANDGFGPLAGYLDGPARLGDRGRRLAPVTWLQSAGDTAHQTWAGPAWDADANGVLEFAPRTFPLPAGRWSRELNFVGWQPRDGALTGELPAGTRLRLSLQWTEAQDATAAVDPLVYRTPLNRLQPVILRQRDASGKRASTDDLTVVARAAALPMLIDRRPGSATFEHVIDWVADAAGSYAVRIEAALAPTTAPSDVPTIPAAKQFGEVYPRLSIAADAGPGRPVFLDFRSVAGGVGTPGDARSAVVVGAADAAGQAQPYSARGTAPILSLNDRSSFLTFDEFAFGIVSARGTGVANGFAGGTLAAMLSAGGPPSADLRWLRIAPGGPLQVPSAWLDQLLHTTGLRERAAYLLSPMDRPPRSR
jgi:hypothetical protein